MIRRKQPPWRIWLVRDVGATPARAAPYELFYGPQPPTPPRFHRYWDFPAHCYQLAHGIDPQDWERFAPASLHLQPGAGPLEIVLQRADRNALTQPILDAMNDMIEAASKNEDVLLSYAKEALFEACRKLHEALVHGLATTNADDECQDRTCGGCGQAVEDCECDNDDPNYCPDCDDSPCHCKLCDCCGQAIEECMCGADDDGPDECRDCGYNPCSCPLCDECGKRDCQCTCDADL